MVQSQAQRREPHLDLTTPHKRSPVSGIRDEFTFVWRSVLLFETILTSIPLQIMLLQSWVQGQSLGLRDEVSQKLKHF